MTIPCTTVEEGNLAPPRLLLLLFLVLLVLLPVLVLMLQLVL